MATSLTAEKEHLLEIHEEVEVDETTADFRVEIRHLNGRIVRYNTLAHFEQDISTGRIYKETEARLIPPGEFINDTPDDDVIEWSPVAEVINSESSLKMMYRPVWEHCLKGIGIGAICGIALKSIDTIATYFMADTALGFIMLALFGSLLFRSWWAPALVVILSMKAGFSPAVFPMFGGALFTTALIGAVFGIPCGMAIGTITGMIRKRNLRLSPYALSEGNKPVVLGLVLPVLFLAAAIPFYLFYIIPKIAEMVF